MKINILFEIINFLKTQKNLELKLGNNKVNDYNKWIVYLYEITTLFK